MTWLIAAIVILVALVALAGAWAYQTANRLDRLHVRYDLSWQALDGALARRAVVARAVAIDAYGGAPEGRRLAALFPNGSLIEVPGARTFVSLDAPAPVIDAIAKVGATA